MNPTPPGHAAKPYLVAWFAMRAVGMPEHAIAPIIGAAVRKATGLSPAKARVWITGELLAAESANASYAETFKAKAG